MDEELKYAYKRAMMKSREYRTPEDWDAIQRYIEFELNVYLENEKN